MESAAGEEDVKFYRWTDEWLVFLSPGDECLSLDVCRYMEQLIREHTLWWQETFSWNIAHNWFYKKRHPSEASAICVAISMEVNHFLFWWPIARSSSADYWDNLLPIWTRTGMEEEEETINWRSTSDDLQSQFKTPLASILVDSGLVSGALWMSCILRLFLQTSLIRK